MIAQWLDAGSREKAASVISLAPGSVRTVVEIGCGTGAVLRALDRLGFAQHYWACEPDQNLFSQIPTEEIGRLVDTSQSTFGEAFDGERFDLAILTHVVEHLLTPASLVSEALQRARYVLVEVPLDGSPSGRARARVRRFFGHDRLDNAAGHVQFFSRRGAQDLIRFSGGTILADRQYFPHDATAAAANQLHRKLVVRLAKVEALGRVYHQHYAMLAERAAILAWDHHYHKPS
jgi:SAM-dependent methyltransferase